MIHTLPCVDAQDSLTKASAICQTWLCQRSTGTQKFTTHRYTMQPPQYPVLLLPSTFDRGLLQCSTEWAHAFGHDVDGSVCFDPVQELQHIGMPNSPKFSQCVLGQRELIALRGRVSIEFEYRHRTTIVLHERSAHENASTRSYHTRFVPSYNDHIDLPSNELFSAPREKGKLRPDFCTKDETAADPRVRR